MNKPVVFLSSLACLAIVLLTSCGRDANDPGTEFMPDMYRSPAYAVYSSNPNFADSLTMQTPVKGTIPRGYAFFSYPSTLEGYEAAGRDVKNPLLQKDNVSMQSFVHIVMAKQVKVMET